jgi:hypothetical protein
VKQVFVSYSHEDEGPARELKHALADLGFAAWLAADEIRPGDRVAEHVLEGLRSSDAVVLLIGRQPSSWARYEWSLALQLSWDSTREVPLIPVMLHGAEPPVFLRDQPLVQIFDESEGWGSIANALRATPVRRWQTTDAGRSELAGRLTELERTAATLSDKRCA